MILNKCIITNLFLIIIFYLCGINASAQNQTDQLNTIRFHQSYPNPFNPTTSIQYAVSSPQFVSLKVYDVLGNEVDFSVGQNSILSSGIYFYQLHAGSFIQTRKMILIK